MISALQKANKSVWILISANLLVFVLVVSSVSMGVLTLNLYSGFFTKDVASIAEIIPIAGALSQLGIILWSISFAVTAFSVLLLQAGQNRQLMLMLSLLNLVLVADDTFQIHEKFFPRLFGLSELTLIGFEAAILLIIVTRFYTTIAKYSHRFLFLAFFWFSVSLSVDFFIAESIFPNWHHLLEDGPKFVGIVNWAFFCIATSYFIVQE